ncbi:hypothetical protein, partial [Micromonospora chalcea]
MTPGVFVCTGCALWAARRATTFAVVRRLPAASLKALVRWARPHAHALSLVLQPGMLTSAELRFGAVGVRGQPPSIMGGCV